MSSWREPGRADGGMWYVPTEKGLALLSTVAREASTRNCEGYLKKAAEKPLSLAMSLCHHSNWHSHIQGMYAKKAQIAEPHFILPVCSGWFLSAALLMTSKGAERSPNIVYGSLLFQAALLSQLAVIAAEMADDWSEKWSWIAVPNLHSVLLVSVWSISLCTTQLVAMNFHASQEPPAQTRTSRRCSPHPAPLFCYFDLWTIIVIIVIIITMFLSLDAD